MTEDLMRYYKSTPTFAETCKYRTEESIFKSTHRIKYCKINKNTKLLKSNKTFKYNKKLQAAVN